MKPHRFKKYLLVLSLLGFSGSGWAAMFPNPSPGTLGNDIDGNGLFYPGDQVLSLELFDLEDLLTAIDPITYAFTGFDFGFYYAGDVSNRNAVFDILDFSVASPQAALIDFGSGTILDLDNPLLSTGFTTQGTDTPIGFYLQLTLLGLPLGDAIYTQAEENPGDIDLAGVYPVIGTPDAFGIGFAIPLDGNNPPTLLPLGAYIVGPVSPVPIPGALGLWLLGLGGLALFRRWIGGTSSGQNLRPAGALG